MNFSSADMIRNKIDKLINGLYWSGSLHRQEPIINDFDIITMRPLDEVEQDFKDIFNCPVTKSRGGKKYIQLQIKGVNFDIWRALDKTEYFFKKTLRNLDKEHSIYWHNQAKKRGYTLSETGLYRGDHKLKVRSLKKLRDIINIDDK